METVLTALETGIRKHLSDGNPKKAVELVNEHYGPMIYGYVFKFLRSRENANDVFQEFWLRLIRGMEMFEGRSTVRTWAFRIAHNEAMRFLGNPNQWRVTRLSTTFMACQAAEDAGNTYMVNRVAVKDGFELLWDEFNLREKAILTLKIEQEMGSKEIVEILAQKGETLSRANVRKIYQRSREKFYRLARERGLIEETKAAVD